MISRLLSHDEMVGLNPLKLLTLGLHIGESWGFSPSNFRGTYEYSHRMMMMNAGDGNDDELFCM